MEPPCFEVNFQEINFYSFDLGLAVIQNKNFLMMKKKIKTILNF
jgi:hypothetical protein